MFFILLLFFTAALVSASAAYFSIVGLVTIFASAPISIIVMGSSLELAKLVAASWLYRNWDIAPALLKYYFSIAVILLSIITSVGIFGYLSRAHIDQTIGNTDTVVQVQILEQQITNEKQRLAILLRQEQNYTGPNRRFENNIKQTQNSINSLSRELTPLLRDKAKSDAELGPIKYIADLFYGTDDTDSIDRAVRLIIISLIVVFDPMAILLIIAGNIAIIQRKQAQAVEIIPSIVDAHSINLNPDEIYDISKAASSPSPVKPRKPTI